MNKALDRGIREEESTGCRLISLPGRHRVAEAFHLLAGSSWIAVYDYGGKEDAYSLREATEGFTLPASLDGTQAPWSSLFADSGRAVLQPDSAGEGARLMPADHFLAIPLSLPDGAPSCLYLAGFNGDTPRGLAGSTLPAELGEVITWCETGNLHLSARRLMTRIFGLLASITRDLADIADPLDLMDTVAGLLVRHLDAVAGCISLESSDLLEGEFPRHVFFPAGRESFLKEVFGNGGPEGFDLASLPSISDSFPPVNALPFDVPLRHGNRRLGRILVWIPEQLSRELSLHIGNKEAVLSELSDEVGLRLMNLSLLRRSENLLAERQNRLRELWILQETNNALRGTLEITRILKMILAGATVASGLGFNRAALLLLNEKTGLLQGMLGVGPDSREDAERIWSELSEEFDLPLARQIERYAETQPPSSFDGLVKSIRIPLPERGGVISRCISDRIPVNVAEALPEFGPEGVVYRRLSLQAFAAVPIVARDRVFGVMIVDNRFDGKEITTENMRLLIMFAEQAGLAISNAREHRAHRRAAEDLRIARDQLVQTERLAVLGEVAASLAHEIRNPLVTIGGFARRLAGKLHEGDPNEKYASIIATEVERLESFLEEILLFGQERAPRMGPVDLPSIIDETVALYATGFAEAGIEVLQERDDNLPDVDADAGQLKQVFINLFTNALDVMPQGGTLRIALHRDGEAPDTIILSVEDSGGGVDPEVLGSIFNPFFTTKSGGHGLGLSLTQRIVTAHGGRINVRNSPGEGLAFLIGLPARRAGFSGDRAENMNGGGRQ